MSLLRAPVLTVLGSDAARALVTGPLGRSVAARFVAGETLDDALGVAADLRGRGIRTILDHLGENVASPVQEAAAVADYTPVEPGTEKTKKSDGPLTLTLTRTRDILADLGRLPSRAAHRPVLVGFAAETSNVVEYAKGKLTQKGADLIVANDVSRSDAGFDVDTNAVTLVSRAGVQELPLQTKAAVAATLVDRLEEFLAAQPVKEDRKSTRLNSSHVALSRMPSSA